MTTRLLEQSFRIFLSFSFPCCALSQPLNGILGILDGMRMMFLGKISSTKEEEPQPLKVIGAGLGRTGTGSLYKALEILHYKSTHMVHVFESYEYSGIWESFIQREVSAEEVLGHLRDHGYNARLDFPTVNLWETQHRLYPDAKVILTVRDSPLQWVRSWRVLKKMENLLDAPFSFYFPNPLSILMPAKFRQMHAVRCHHGVGLWGLEPCEFLNGGSQSDEWFMDLYERHLDKVKETVPPEQLLVFNVKQGWGPLCQFLDVQESECPQEPFPHAGDTRFLKTGILVCQVLVWAWIPILLFLIWHAIKKFLARKKTTVKAKSQ